MMSHTARAVLTLAAALACSGCVSRIDPLAGAPKEVREAAVRRASVEPSPVSTLDFKEQGESRRFTTLHGLIAQTWHEDCRVTSAVSRFYTPRGDSVWAVKCAGSTIAYDYSVFLPERRAAGARVLQCYPGRPGQMLCNMAGRPA